MGAVFKKINLANSNNVQTSATYLIKPLLSIKEKKIFFIVKHSENMNFWMDP